MQAARLELLRDFAFEQLSDAQFQADIAQRQLEIGDDAAMAYAMRRFVLHARAAAKTANEIASLKAGGGL